MGGMGWHGVDILICASLNGIGRVNFLPVSSKAGRSLALRNHKRGRCHSPCFPMPAPRQHFEGGTGISTTLARAR